MSAAAAPFPAVCLVVLDGWGVAEPGPGNAVSLARTPVFDRLWRTSPHTTLRAGGRAVGLPEGQMGNSEVGHLNLGAGAVVAQDLVRIDDAIAAGAVRENPVIGGALTASGRVHLIGLVSDGGVHSSLAHLLALIGLARELGTRELFVHCITDGRDTPPHSGAAHVARLEAALLEASGGARAAGGTIADRRFAVASVVGRYFAMDRDRRWERTQMAYDLFVHGTAPHVARSAVAAVQAAYERGESDEFITATRIVSAQADAGRPRAGGGDPGAGGADSGSGRIEPGDSVLCFNFRPDRMRQIVRALAEPDFGEGAEELPGWEGRRGAPPVSHLATLTEYEEGWTYPVAFPPARPRTTLAAVLADAGASQLHVAETEKYAHVTYFFNGGEERPFAGERRTLVPSPRDVPTYDRKPEMSAREATDAFLEGWGQERPRFAILNFANPDMVGHTGIIPAAVRAVETVDSCLGEVVDAVLGAGGACLVTADHGNAEEMLQPDGSASTAHSLNPVPFVLVLPAAGSRQDAEGAAAPPGRASPELREGGVLADVAPTVLALLGIATPPEMTGSSLLMGP
jgi:2,3-bisphosphoglycerate-independent phosphoglycerate mutase